MYYIWTSSNLTHRPEFTVDIHLIGAMVGEEIGQVLHLLTECLKWQSQQIRKSDWKIGTLCLHVI